MADNIQLTATVDGVLTNTLTSADGNLDVNAQSFGLFNINTVSINSSTFLAPGGVLNTNTIDVDQTTSGNHQLILDIKAFNIAGVNAVRQLLSSFSVTGQTQTGWTAREQTFINGTLLADTGIFNVVSDSAFSINPAFLGPTFTAEAIYTINSSGTGQFNGGIDINLAAVPGPVVGAGLPGLVAGLIGMVGLSRSRRRTV
jgi:hypothetical protein